MRSLLGVSAAVLMVLATSVTGADISQCTVTKEAKAGDSVSGKLEDVLKGKFNCGGLPMLNFNGDSALNLNEQTGAFSLSAPQKTTTYSFTATCWSDDSAVCGNGKVIVTVPTTAAPATTTTSAPATTVKPTNAATEPATTKKETAAPTTTTAVPVTTKKAVEETTAAVTTQQAVETTAATSAAGATTTAQVDTKKPDVTTIAATTTVEATTAEPTTTAVPSTPVPTPEPTTISTEFNSVCRGTCPGNVFTAKDGFGPQPSATFVEKDGKILMTVKTTIAALVAEFPAFCELSLAKGAKLNSAAALGANSLYGFTPGCLNRQGSSGSAADVFDKGVLGPKQATGKSWFQHFGGLHSTCNIFNGTDICDFAPFLAANNDGWKIQVSNCGVTWTKKATLTSLEDEKCPVSGGRLFKGIEGGQELKGDLIVQAVKPKNLTAPESGIVSKTHKFPFYASYGFAVRPSMREKKNGQLRRLMSTGFAVDAEVYSYATQKNQRTFAYNVKVYTPRNLRRNETEVRRVVVDKSAFGGAKAGDFELSFGERGSSTCIDDNDRWLARGVSDAVGSDGSKCPHFQNVTLRFTAKSNTSAADIQAVNGDVQFTLTLANYQQIVIGLEQTPYLKQVSTTKAQPLKVEVCRSTAYWPVLDPVGDSTPVNQYKAPKAEKEEEKGKKKKDEDEDEDEEEVEMNGVEEESKKKTSLCHAKNDKVVGPKEWSYITVTHPGRHMNASVDFLSLSYVREETTGVPNVFYLIAPKGEKAAISKDGSTVFDWKKGASFLNFRNLPTEEDQIGRFLFTPGTALNDEDGNKVTVYVDGQISVWGSKQVYGFRTEITIDKRITLVTRGDDGRTSAYERHHKKHDKTAGNFALMVSLGLAGAVVVLGAIAIYFDEGAKKAVKGMVGSSTPAPPAAKEEKKEEKKAEEKKAAPKPEAEKKAPEAEAPRVKQDDEESPIFKKGDGSDEEEMKSTQF